ncbi:MAG: FHA domain-containing protein [Planctomycetes bacterium]|nr:FHA domain-containing protein [Planctomycetota bacterium]
MRLVVEQDGNVIHEFQFANGPVNIGRHADSQVFLSDRTVSRHHAVIYSTAAGKWMVEDLDSANKTFLNDKEIHKSEIKSGDEIRITNFNIKINLEDDTIVDKPINLEDTLTTAVRSPDETSSPLEARMIIRRIEPGHSPDINMPIKRARDFSAATEAICKTNSLDEMLKVLLNIIQRQFSAYHIWCALRNQPSGDMSCHAGKKRGGGKVVFDKIKLKDKITQAVDKKQLLLFPRIPPGREKEPIRSAMIAPIIGSGGCFGVVYLDNDMSHEHYTLNDLDYLIMLVIHTSVILENF